MVCLGFNKCKPLHETLKRVGVKSRLRRVRIEVVCPEAVVLQRGTDGVCGENKLEMTKVHLDDTFSTYRICFVPQTNIFFLNTVFKDFVKIDQSNLRLSEVGVGKQFL